MNIIEPYAHLLDMPDRPAGVALLKKIEWCGRISHRSEEAQTEESYDRFLRSVVLGHGDWSIVEHAVATVDAIVDRGITHEWVRHRLGSYTQESTRFVNYEKKMPPREMWRHAIRVVEQQYLQLLAQGCTPQIARSVFPNSLASRIATTYNLRNWRHFFLMRTTREAHPQMR